MKTKVVRIFVIALLAALPLSYNACGKITQRDFLPVFTSTKTGNPLTPSSALTIAPFQGGASSIVICVKRIELQQYGGQTTSDYRIDYLQEITITPDGVDMEVGLPAATYREIEFKIDNDCGSGKSVQVTNEHGTFSTDDSMEIKFNGYVDGASVPGSVQLMFQSIAESLGQVRNDSQIRQRAEASGGSY